MKKLMSKRRTQVIVVLLCAAILLIFYLAPRNFIAPFLDQSGDITSCTVTRVFAEEEDATVTIEGDTLSRILDLMSTIKVQMRGSSRSAASDRWETYHMTFLNDQQEAVGYATVTSSGYQYAGANRYKLLGSDDASLTVLLYSLFTPNPSS